MNGAPAGGGKFYNNPIAQMQIDQAMQPPSGGYGGENAKPLSRLNAFVQGVAHANAPTAYHRGRYFAGKALEDEATGNLGSVMGQSDALNEQMQGDYGMKSAAGKFPAPITDEDISYLLQSVETGTTVKPPSAPKLQFQGGVSPMQRLQQQGGFGQ